MEDIRATRRALFSWDGRFSLEREFKEELGINGAV
jgi:hypothetical protein